MKGIPELIDTLNDLLASELAAINQYMVHAEMAEDWGYERLSKNFKTRSITEMTHAERLIERILFLEGTPIVSNLDDIHIGATIPQQVDNDHASELTAIKMYNEAIVQAGNVLDYATRDILEAILRDEDKHLDELEELQDQLEQMTLPTFVPVHAELPAPPARSRTRRRVRNAPHDRPSPSGASPHVQARPTAWTRSGAMARKRPRSKPLSWIVLEKRLVANRGKRPSRRASCHRPDSCP